MRFRSGVAIDLGTVNTLVSAAGRGLVIDEPSAIALDRATGRVAAVGQAADALADKEPQGVEVLHPLRDGVIADLEAASAMLQGFVRRARLRRGLLRTAAVVCVPGGATWVERRSLAAALSVIRPRCTLQLVDEPIAAAAGAGFDLAQGAGAFIVDVGGGTTESAIVAGGQIVRARSLRVGGNAMDDAIVSAVKAELGLLLGRNAARSLKTTLGLDGEATGSMETVGVDAARRTPGSSRCRRGWWPGHWSTSSRRSWTAWRRCSPTSRPTWPRTWSGGRSGWPGAARCCPAWPTGSRRPPASRPWSWTTRCAASPGGRRRSSSAVTGCSLVLQPRGNIEQHGSSG